MYVLKVFGSGGKAVAGIGQNTLGAGTAQVADADGTVKAFLSVDGSGKGKAFLVRPRRKWPF